MSSVAGKGWSASGARPPVHLHTLPGSEPPALEDSDGGVAPARCNPKRLGIGRGEGPYGTWLECLDEQVAYINGEDWGDLRHRKQ